MDISGNFFDRCSFELIDPMLDAGCNIGIQSYQPEWLLADTAPGVPQDQIFKDKPSIKLYLTEWLGRRATDFHDDGNSVNTIRKMQIQGYRLSKGKKLVFTKCAWWASKYKLEEENIPAEQLKLPNEKEFTSMITLKEPLSLLAQCRFNVRRCIIKRKENIYSTLEKSDIPVFVQDILLMKNGDELNKCLGKFGDASFFDRLKEICNAWNQLMPMNLKI